MGLRSIPNRDGIGIDRGMDLFLSALVRGTDEDKAVMVSDSDTVALVTEGSNFCGVVRAIDQHNKDASVQMEEWAELPYTGSDPAVGWNYLVGGSEAGKIAVATPAPAKITEITIAAEATSGSSAADADLVGGEILGFFGSTNIDQIVKTVTLAENGAITVTLLAAATAENKINVAVQKSPISWPQRYFVSKVDTVAKKAMVRLG
jgi:hypothetical protein